jgi:anthraniloyl-CoA monooxygenase
VITSGGHGFCGIERRHLLNILQRRAMALGVELLFQQELDDVAAFPDADLIVAADGVNSKVRGRYAAHFKPTIDVRKNRFIWLGTHRMFQAFTFIFVETAHGWFQAHAYRFNHDTSTFIVETTEQNWRAAGLDQLDTAGAIRFCERLFEPWLQGHRLLANMSHLRGSQWLNFPRVANESWTMGNVVLMGDAAHSAHFSIGSGTKLALEDAIALARAFDTHGTNVPAALAAYEAERKTEVLRVQSAARNSSEWFENVARYVHLEPEQFAYSLLTRSQRISHENLRLRDRPWLEGMERWLADRVGHPARSIPMFLRSNLGRCGSPTGSSSRRWRPIARDGLPSDFHLVHLGARALYGRTVFTEMVCVTPQGRITRVARFWSEEQMRAGRASSFSACELAAKICLNSVIPGRKVRPRSVGTTWMHLCLMTIGADRALRP